MMCLFNASIYCPSDINLTSMTLISADNDAVKNQRCWPIKQMQHTRAEVLPFVLPLRLRNGFIAASVLNICRNKTLQASSTAEENKCYGTVKLIQCQCYASVKKSLRFALNPVARRKRKKRRIFGQICMHKTLRRKWKYGRLVLSSSTSRMYSGKCRNYTASCAALLRLSTCFELTANTYLLTSYLERQN